MTVAVALLVLGYIVGEVNKGTGSDVDVRVEEEAVGGEYDLADESSQSPKSDRHPSPQKSGPEPQYSY